MGELNKKYKPVLHLKKQLINGYRRFDPTRGMEYTLDLQLEVVNQKGHSRSITKRVHLVRPLSRIEIIPMPYVTEATRVHIILPVTLQDREQVQQFLEVYATNAFETSENAILTFLFIYDTIEAQQVSQNDIFASVKAQIAAYEHRYPTVKIPWISVKSESPSQIKLMDIISKKHPVDTLFSIATVKTSISSEFLNRCRMNSINNWQCFFPFISNTTIPTLFIITSLFPTPWIWSKSPASLIAVHSPKHVSTTLTTWRLGRACLRTSRRTRISWRTWIYMTCSSNTLASMFSEQWSRPCIRNTATSRVILVLVKISTRGACRAPWTASDHALSSPCCCLNRNRATVLKTKPWRS